MNYSSIDIARLTKGEDVDIRYKDIFLHYRFLKNTEQKPQQLTPPSTLVKTGLWWQKTIKKAQKALSYLPN